MDPVKLGETLVKLVKPELVDSVQHNLPASPIATMSRESTLNSVP